jgi:hypothetical protein
MRRGGSAGYVRCGCPTRSKTRFATGLRAHYPLKAKHVMSRVHEMRGGRERSSAVAWWCAGQLAELLGKRFELRANGAWDTGKPRTPVTTRFKPPAVKRDRSATRIVLTTNKTEEACIGRRRFLGGAQSWCSSCAARPRSGIRLQRAGDRRTRTGIRRISSPCSKKKARRMAPR